MCSRSGKAKSIFTRNKTPIDVSGNTGSSTNFTSIKPLCPTRFLTRSPAIISVINSYNFVLASLEDVSNELDGETAATASTLLSVFLKKNTLIALCIASPILKQLENLNGSLQGREKTLSGMLRSVDAIIERFKALRSESEFGKVIKEMNDHYEMLCRNSADKFNIQLDPLSLPRKRFMKDYSAHHPETAEDHFRHIYYMMIDTAISQLKDRFDQPDLKSYSKLEQVLFSDNQTSLTDVPKYPEIDLKDLDQEIQFLRRHARNLKFKNLTNVHIIGEFLSNLDQGTQDLYPNVRSLIKLLLTSPVSTCESERSFSSLRRLKTWLRSTMGQVRLNSLAICHTHQELLDGLNIDSLVEEFISRNNIRKFNFA